jgi:hypothetical protein
MRLHVGIGDDVERLARRFTLLQIAPDVLRRGVAAGIELDLDDRFGGLGAAPGAAGGVATGAQAASAAPAAPTPTSFKNSRRDVCLPNVLIVSS